MNSVKYFLRFFTVEPVNLSIKGKFLSVVTSFMVILVVAWVSQKYSVSIAYPIIIASMGASAVIVLIMPGSPVAQPWPLVGGHLLSATVGIWSAQTFSDKPLASACAVMLSVLVMLLFRCLHPPGAATALTPVMAGDSIISHDYDFVLMPVSVNVAIMLVMAIVINRWLLRYEYPVVVHHADDKKTQTNSVQFAQYSGISTEDMEHALEQMDTFVDVSAADLSRLLSDAQLESFKRSSGNVTCADIMVRNILTVEYGTEVEDTWKIMYAEKLKAMPVIDRSRRVIGIITSNDFFKYIKIDGKETFQEQLRAFIRRTPDISTHKPEAVGHIMTKSVAVLPETTHIAALVPLMSNQGYRQIPIVNHENRLVGMVYQANLIAALYNKKQDDSVNLPCKI